VLDAGRETDLLDLPLIVPGNGQMRRGRIARAIMKASKVLLLDNKHFCCDRLEYMFMMGCNQGNMNLLQIMYNLCYTLQTLTFLLHLGVPMVLPRALIGDLGFLNSLLICKESGIGKRRHARPLEAQAISCPKIADLRAQKLANLCPRIVDLR